MRCINEVLLFENRKIFRVYFFILNLNLIPFFYRVMPIILSRNIYIYVWFNYIYISLILKGIQICINYDTNYLLNSWNINLDNK